MRRYRALLRAPYGPRLLAGAAVLYPGQAALGIVTLLALHHATGSFASAGAAGAADTLAFSASSLLQGRLIDRRGTRALVPMTVACALAVAALATAVAAGTSAAVLIVLSGVVGASIPVAGASLRTVWSGLLDDVDERATAFAYQSLAQDAGFVIGPSALGALATTVSPVLALGCCGALVVAGTLTVATVPSPAVPARGRTGGSERSLLRSLAPIGLTLVSVGVALGAIDVSIAAFATDHHRQQLAGVLLAAFSAGSIVGGLAYGARSWRSRLDVRLLGCVIALAVLSFGPVAAPSIVVIAPALALAGAPLAATLTTAYLLAGELAPSGRGTEAFALLSLALNGGAAVGGALGGLLVAAGSARPGFVLAATSPLVGAAVLALPASVGAIRALRRQTAV
jgi:MFS family permease